MDTVYLNGQFVPRSEAVINPDDRGFLFGDSVYEVTRWYGGYFFDLPAHAGRLRRSLKETRINWQDADRIEEISEKLIQHNGLGGDCAIVYLQVTRGVAPRNHAFPDPPVAPTAYGFAKRHAINTLLCEQGTSLWLTPDPRWNRCDIKSTALLANVMAYQEAHDNGCAEVCFVREGLVTEGAHSNIFFVKNDTLYTHPESEKILSGITRNNIVALASGNDIPLIEEAVAEDMLAYMHESFFCNTTGEIVPVLKIGDQVIGEGRPGPMTQKMQVLFRNLILSMDPRR